MLSVVFWPAMPLCGLLGVVLQAASEAVIVTAARIVAHFIIVPPEHGIARHVTQSPRGGKLLRTPGEWPVNAARIVRSQLANDAEAHASAARIRGRRLTESRTVLIRRAAP